MGLLKKFQGAITYWTDANARRSGIFATTLTYAGSLALIGIIFLGLAASGKFPSHVNQHPSQLAFYCIKYALYILAATCAWISIRLACHSLTEASNVSYMHGQCCIKPAVATAKALLYVAMLALLGSIAMTIVSLARTATSPIHVPGYIYAIEVMVLLARLLLMSTLVLALITLKEAERDPVVAKEVLAGTSCGNSTGTLPTSQVPQNPFMAYQPSEPATKGTAGSYGGIGLSHAGPHDPNDKVGRGTHGSPAHYIQHMPAVPENKSQCNLGLPVTSTHPFHQVSEGAAACYPACNPGYPLNSVAVGSPVKHWQPQHHYYTTPQPAVYASSAPQNTPQAGQMMNSGHSATLGKTMFMH